MNGGCGCWWLPALAWMIVGALLSLGVLGFLVLGRLAALDPKEGGGS